MTSIHHFPLLLILLLLTFTHATNPPINFLSTAALANATTSFTIPLPAALSTVPSDPNLLLIATLTGTLTLHRLSGGYNIPNYTITSNLSQVTLPTGSSILGITSDPFDPTVFFLSVSNLQWRMQGFPASGWQNGRIQRVRLDPVTNILSTPETVVSGLPVSALIGGIYGTVVSSISGRLLVSIYSFTNGGVPAPQEGNLSECLYSGSFLDVNIRMRNFTRQLRWTSDDPAIAELADSASVSGIRLHATGIRSAFQPVYTNKHVVFTVDGGASTDGGPRSLTCTTEEPFPVSQPDKVIRVRRGRWYGHANRRRGEINPQECTQVLVSELTEENVRMFPGYEPPLVKTSFGGVGTAQYTATWFEDLRDMVVGCQTAVRKSEDVQQPVRGILKYDVENGVSERIANVTGVGMTVDAYGNILTAQVNANNIGVAIPQGVGKKNGIGSVFPWRGMPGTRIFILGVGLDEKQEVRIGSQRCGHVERRGDFISCVVPWPRRCEKGVKGCVRFPTNSKRVSVGKYSVDGAFLVIDPRWRWHKFRPFDDLA